LLFPQLGFAAFGDLQGIMAYRLDVKCDLERRKSVRASTVKPYERSEAHFVSMSSNSGAIDSGSRDVRGRNVVSLRR
jgi:hypothetical protein